MERANGDGVAATRTEREVLEAIEARRRRPRRKLAEDHVTLSHGAGGRASRDLVEAVFLDELRNPLLERLGDSAVLEDAAGTGARLAFTTDSFVVRPLFFNGGDIGELAVNGTVNDLAMAGAKPLSLSAGFIVEEGLAVDELRRVAASMGSAARQAGVAIAAADTKVVERGSADGLYINTSGVGMIEGELDLDPRHIRPGDRVLVSGTLGDHGMAVMVERGELELEADLASDTAALHELVETLIASSGGEGSDGSAVRCLRDPTRGGLATVLAELALSSDLGIAIDESALPVRPEVNGACEILGIDPLYVANEGKLAAVVNGDAAEAALAVLRSHPLGRDAAIVGEVRDEPAGLVLLETAFGGTRVVNMLAGDPLPQDLLSMSAGARVAIFGPNPLLSVAIEMRGEGEEEDIHIHAAGQGVWVARMAGELGAEPVLCGFAGGETGVLLRPLLERMAGERRLVETTGDSGCYVIDRRSGERQLVSQVVSPPPSRHELDELFSLTCAAALESDVLVVCNPYPGEALPLDVYGKLVTDVRDNGTPVVVDLSSPRLDGALEGRPDLVKLNDWELAQFISGPVDTTERLRAGAVRLSEHGARSVLVTRGADPALALRDGNAWTLTAPRFEGGHHEGCGDSMVGGIAAGLAAGLDWEQALVQGAAAGAANFLHQGLGTGSRDVVQDLRQRVELTRA